MRGIARYIIAIVRAIAPAEEDCETGSSSVFCCSGEYGLASTGAKDSNECGTEETTKRLWREREAGQLRNKEPRLRKILHDTNKENSNFF